MRRLGRRLIVPRSIRTTRVSGSRLCSPLPPPLLPRKGAETQGVPSDVSSSSQWEEEEDEAWEACAVSYGDAYEEVPLSPLVACVPSSPSSPISPAEEKWSFPPSPLPLPNSAFAASTCSAPIAGPERYTGWHPRPRASPLRLALAVEPLSLLASHSPCTRAPCSSSSPSPYSAQERGQQQCQQDPERERRRSARAGPPPLSSVHSAHARRSPGGASASPKTFAFVRAAGVRRYMHMHLPCAKSPSPSSFAKGCGMKTKPKPKPMGSATVLSTPKRKGKGKGGKRLTVEDVCLVIAPAPAPGPPATPTCGASTPRQRWSYSSRASASSARVSPSPSGSGSESDSGHSDSVCGSDAAGGARGCGGSRSQCLALVQRPTLSFLESALVLRPISPSLRTHEYVHPPLLLHVLLCRKRLTLSVEPYRYCALPRARTSSRRRT
ncbi:hypothetical protein DFH08DRAFT_517621 [Mycena albidolilacea]|uniref:Uncharacterized protein n=1 Tax=Mycena albidolilacea TaxID=1033008 RepID=A0AAD6Z342_9AGAR|nr:hypothetical protein DFH08DRAFT_517621 [Mycena albidolilacea]